MDIEQTASQAFKKAEEKALAAGLSVLCVRGGYLVEVFSDGSKKVIKKTNSWVKVDKKHYTI